MAFGSAKTGACGPRVRLMAIACGTGIMMAAPALSETMDNKAPGASTNPAPVAASQAPKATPQAPLVQNSPTSEPTKPEISSAANEGSEWRDALLAELTALANELEKQGKFNSMLRDRIDILNHRIEELETANKTQAETIEALKSQQDQLAKAVPENKGEPTEAPKDQQALAPETDTPSPVQKESGKQDEGDLPNDFEQFLDMGEAMMRRFFGVVKEFRKEFEDNRV